MQIIALHFDCDKFEIFRIFVDKAQDRYWRISVARQLVLDRYWRIDVARQLVLDRYWRNGVVRQLLLLLLLKKVSVQGWERVMYTLSVRRPSPTIPTIDRKKRKEKRVEDYSRDRAA